MSKNKKKKGLNKCIDRREEPRKVNMDKIVNSNEEEQTKNNKIVTENIDNKNNTITDINNNNSEIDNLVESLNKELLSSEIINYLGGRLDDIRDLLLETSGKYGKRQEDSLDEINYLSKELTSIRDSINNNVKNISGKIEKINMEFDKGLIETSNDNIKKVLHRLNQNSENIKNISISIGDFIIKNSQFLESIKKDNQSIDKLKFSTDKIKEKTEEISDGLDIIQGRIKSLDEIKVIS